MENFVATITRMRLPVCIFFIVCIVGGIYSALSLPIDSFPDLVNNQVQVLTEAPGMGPEESEQLITIPIESTMNGLPNVAQIRSISKYGLSVVTVVFDEQVNVYFARQLVLERLQTAKSRLPRNINPELGPLSTAMGEIFQYILAGTNTNIMALKTINDWDVKYRLRAVPGVADVNTWGGKTMQYVVTIFPYKLVQHKLTLKEIFETLSQNNENFGAGIVNSSGEQYIIRGLARVKSLADIEDTVVKVENGIPIAIKNIANVEIGTGLRQGAVCKDGKGEIVTGIVMMLKGENSREVIQRVKRQMDEIQKTLPTGLTLSPFYDQTNLVENTINTVKTNLIEGGLLVLAVLMVMLGNFRAAILVALVIPISLLFSFIGMKWLGLSANIMSLGAIDFGMIVDGSIVMIENIIRRLSQKESETANREVIDHCVREMTRPILFGVLIITVVYLPVLSLQGMEYKMFSPMVLTVCFALLGSLITALFLIPVLATFVFTGEIKDHEIFFLKYLKVRYLVTLDWSLSHKKLVLTTAGISFLLAISSISFLGTEFIPQLDEGDIVVQSRMPTSISLPEAIRLSTLIEKSIMQTPEINSAESRIGRPDLATDPMGVYQADIFVMLKPREEWRKGLTKSEIVSELRHNLNQDIPATLFNFTQPIAMRVDELVSGVKAQIAVKIYGDDILVLQKIANEILQVVKKIPGQIDLQTEQLFGSNQILVKPDRNKMLRYGVNVGDIRTLMETAVIGTSASEVIEGRKRFDLTVKFPGGNNLSTKDLANLLIETSDGKRIPIEQVAEITVLPGLDVINREFGQRRIIVQCNVANTDVGTFVVQAQKDIAAQVKLPPGYFIKWGGQFENQSRAMERLAIVVPISIAVIFLLLWATFQSGQSASLVLLNVPFSLIGGIVALWIRGMYLSVPAAIGFIALFGVAVLNGVVLISYANDLLRSGLSSENAIKEAAATRLRPVLITAIVAIFGFLPMAISHGSGAEVQKPLATVVIGGLVTSTLLTLIVLPVLYALVSKRRS